MLIHMPSNLVTQFINFNGMEIRQRNKTAKRIYIYIVSIEFLERMTNHKP